MFLARSRKRGNEPLGFIKGWRFLFLLSHYHFIKKGSSLHFRIRNEKETVITNVVAYVGLCDDILCFLKNLNYLN